MAEPYVPIATYTTYNNLLTALEVTTNAAATNADAISTAVTNSAASASSASATENSKFNLFMLVGA
jgi:hypothetical protein